MEIDEIIARGIAGHFGPNYDDLPTDSHNRRIRIRAGENFPTDDTQLGVLDAAATAIKFLHDNGLVIVTGIIKKRKDK